MRITIVGGGAVGGTLAAKLLLAGDEDVTVVARPGEHADRLRKDGLRFREGDEDHRVHPDVVHKVPKNPGLLVLAIKTQDLPALLPGLRETRPDAVIGLQNGVLADGWIVDAVGPAGTYGAVVSFDAEYLQPGEVKLLRAHGITLGRVVSVPGEDQRNLLEIAHRLARAIPVHLTENLQGARWMKLLVNLNNALPAATGLSLQEAYESPLLSWVAARALREGVKIVRKENVRLERIPLASPKLVRTATRLPSPVAGRLLARRAREVLGHRAAYASTYQSLARGRRTEIDYLNGEVSRLGRKHHVATPANDALVAAVKAAERGEGFTPVGDLARRALIGRG